MLKVRNGLRRIDNRDGTVLVSCRDNVLHGEHNAGSVYGGSYRDNLGTAAE